MTSGEVLTLEQAVAATFPEALAVIGSERMNAERRALRIRVRDLAHEYENSVLRVRFALDSGSFATTVLREIITATSGDD
jgi:tRNA pseudouridine13 synthase